MPCKESPLAAASSGYADDQGRYGLNKHDLIEATTASLGGSRRDAESAVNSVLDNIMRAVASGEKVSLPGFGTFERRDRAARTARNPQTGEKVRVRKTRVPAFRAGASFKEYAAAGKMPKAAAKSTATKPAAKSATSKSTASKRAAAKSSDEFIQAWPKKGPATRAAAKKGTTKTAAKKTAKKTARKR